MEDGLYAAEVQACKFWSCFLPPQALPRPFPRGSNGGFLERSVGLYSPFQHFLKGKRGFFRCSSLLGLLTLQVHSFSYGTFLYDANPL